MTIDGAQPQDEPVRLGWDPGHHYSPIPDTRELGREPARSRVWPATPPDCPGIDFRGEAQVALARAIAAQQEMVFPAAATGDPAEYHTGNEFFPRPDAWALQGMLRHYRPRSMIEVGCGWSSLVTARVNRDYLDGELDFSCVDPNPQGFLDDRIDGISRLIVAPVQEVPVDRFRQLGEGDVLFIDSSHVAKTGNDVVYLYHEVLPRLRRGVLVHIHDIFLPWDYPAKWVLAGRGWNEQYLVKSFLAFNDSFEVLLGLGWLHQFHPEVLAEAIPGYARTGPASGGSFWIRRSR